MGRGKAATPADISLISAAYWKAKAELKDGAAIGAAKLTPHLPDHIKMATLKKVIADLKKGASADQVATAFQETRKWSKGKAVTDANVAKVKAMLGKNNSTLKNSTRLMAAKLKISHTAVATIVKKKLKYRPLKHVKTTSNSAAIKAKREKIAGEIVKMHQGGVRAKQIYFSDETWADQDSRARFNPQNERMYFPRSVKKSDVMDDLYKPLKQRTPGIMVHITVSAAGGGTMLKPHFVPHKQPINGTYYANMLESDTFRQIDALVPEGETWYS